MKPHDRYILLARQIFIIFHTGGKVVTNSITNLTFNANEPGYYIPDLIKNTELYNSNHLNTYRIRERINFLAFILTKTSHLTIKEKFCVRNLTAHFSVEIS